MGPFIPISSESIGASTSTMIDDEASSKPVNIAHLVQEALADNLQAASLRDSE
jgi:hypothetical protein